MIAILTAVTTVYWICGASAVLFQARLTVARRTSAGISLRFMATSVGGYALGLTYGLAIGSIALVLSSVVGLTCGAFTVAVILKYRPASARSNAR